MNNNSQSSRVVRGWALEFRSLSIVCGLVLEIWRFVNPMLGSRHGGVRMGLMDVVPGASLKTQRVKQSWPDCLASVTELARARRHLVRTGMHMLAGGSPPRGDCYGCSTSGPGEGESL